MVVSTDEESHRYYFDLRHVDEIGFGIALHPLCVVLLEAVSQAIHDPVLLGLDRLALFSRIFRVILAEDAGEVLADRGQILIPVGAVDGIDAN